MHGLLIPLFRSNTANKPNHATVNRKTMAPTRNEKALKKAPVASNNSDTEDDSNNIRPLSNRKTVAPTRSRNKGTQKKAPAAAIASHKIKASENNSDTDEDSDDIRPLSNRKAVAPSRNGKVQKKVPAAANTSQKIKPIEDEENSDTEDDVSMDAEHDRYDI